jgi:hypothetical protein
MAPGGMYFSGDEGQYTNKSENDVSDSIITIYISIYLKFTHFLNLNFHTDE